jgi:hypothetical protein
MAAMLAAAMLAAAMLAAAMPLLASGRSTTARV